jgi:diphthamide biosynthesis protein 7
MTFGIDPSESPDGKPKDNDMTRHIATLSGGDDMYLRSTHITIPATSTSTPSSSDVPSSSLIFQDRRIHTAGVTALLPLTSNLLITGNYDDHIRLVHIPSISASSDGTSVRQGPMRPQILAESDLGGGVWRIKILEDERDGASEEPDKLVSKSILLLVSCMHAGTRIVRLVRTSTGDADEGVEWEFRVEAEFTEHKSMNYGSDVKPRRIDPNVVEGGQEHGRGEERQKQRRTIVSTSFYDKLLCLWHWES